MQEQKRKIRRIEKYYGKRTYMKVNVQNILELNIFPNAGACNELL